MDIISWGIQFIKDLIAGLGYPGILALMTLESMCLPVPSEIVLPFGGWLAFDGRLDVFWVAMTGTVGCALGSVIAYALGYYGGRPLILRYGRYVFLEEKHLLAAECWFRKYGDYAVFGSRLLPVVRTFISLPAGVCRTNFSRFVVLSFLGSLPWCFALAYGGYYLGASWDSLAGAFNYLTIIVLIVLLALFIWFYFIRKRKKCEVEPNSGER